MSKKHLSIVIIGFLLVLYAMVSRNPKAPVDDFAKNSESPSHETSTNEQSYKPAQATEVTSLQTDLSAAKPQQLEPQVDESPKGEKSPEKKPTLEHSRSHLRYELYGKYVITGGDILLGEIKDEDQPRWAQGSGRIPWNRRVDIWPQGIVPIAVGANISDALAEKIKEAINIFHQETHIRFVNFRDEKDAVLFVTDPDRCASYVGRVGGHQPILLGEDCGVKEILHELMHTLGFAHEHQRSTRDRFVTVHMQAIQDDKLINFDILPDDYQEIYRRLTDDFDWKSLTLYPPNAFAKEENGITLSSKNSGYNLQPSDRLSPGDIQKIEEVYIRGL